MTLGTGSSGAKLVLSQEDYDCLPRTSREILGYLSSQPGPRDAARSLEDLKAASGCSLSPEACWKYGVNPVFIKYWFAGREFDLNEEIEQYVLPDYPKWDKFGERVSDEIDRLHDIHKIIFYDEEVEPSDLNISSANIIVKQEKLRIVIDWSADECPLNAAMASPETSYASIESFVAMLFPRCFVFGCDFQDCFLHWLVSATSRRYLGFRHPLHGQKGTYLFYPFGLGCSPGVNDESVKEVLRVVLEQIPEIRLVDFVDDLRGVAKDHRCGAKQLEVYQDSLIKICTELGVMVHHKAGKLIRPCQVIDFLGFLFDTIRMEVGPTPKKRQEGLVLATWLVDCFTKRVSVPARDLAGAVGFFNFLATVVDFARPYLMSFWSILSDAGVYRQWCDGKKFYNPLVKLTNEAYQDALWWQQALKEEFTVPIHYKCGRAFLWNPAVLRDSTLLASLPNDFFITVSVDAAGNGGWGAQVGERLLQGAFPDNIRGQHINIKEFFTMVQLCRLIGHEFRGQVLLFKTDNNTARHYCNVGIGPFRILTGLAKELRKLQAKHCFRAVAAHIPGSCNVIADALSRGFISDAGDATGTRCIKPKFFSSISQQLGSFDYDMMCSDDGHNDVVGTGLFRSPSLSAFECDWTAMRTWWFPSSDLVYLVLEHLVKTLNRLSAAEKPFFAILIPMYRSFKMQKLLPKLHLLKTYRRGTMLCNIFKDNKWVDCPPLTVQHAVYLSRPLTDWK